MRTCELAPSGDRDGLLDGANDGRDGEMDGLLEGERDGVLDGLFEGFLEGVLEGLDVGAWVGLNWTSHRQSTGFNELHEANPFSSVLFVVVASPVLPFEAVEVQLLQFPPAPVQYGPRVSDHDSIVSVESLEMKEENELVISTPDALTKGRVAYRVELSFWIESAAP